MDHILISSEGEIDVDSFTLLGNSTKREDLDKIGRFGSGLKYAIAKLLDLNIPFRVFSGEREISFSTSPKEFRDQSFDVIEVDDSPTNFTTQMGPDWEAYDCIREIYSNAVDEELKTFGIASEDVEPEGDEGQTNFWIGITEEVEKVMRDKEHYFSFFREDAFYETEKLKIYPSDGHLIIYKNGFKVHEDRKRESAFHYDYPDAKINESRALESVYSTFGSILTILLQEPTDELIARMKRLMHKSSYAEDVYEMQHDWWVWESAHEDWGKAFEDATFVVDSSRNFYEDHIKHKKDVYVAPEKLARRIKKQNPDKIKVLGGGSSDRINNFIEVETAESKQETKLSKAVRYLADAGIDIHYPIKIGKFEEASTVGTVDETESAIVISQKYLAERSHIEVAELLYEEYAHLESGHPDNSREFQSYLIKQVIKYMGLYNKARGEKV